MPSGGDEVKACCWLLLVAGFWLCCTFGELIPVAAIYDMSASGYTDLCLQSHPPLRKKVYPTLRRCRPEMP